MKQKVKYIFRQVVSLFKFMKYFKVNRNNLNAIAAELMRNTHSIEKGLSIDNVRLGFGHAKQKIMMDYVDILSKHDSIYYDEVIKMSVSSLEAYVNYHVKRNYNDDFIPIIKDFLLKYNFYIKDSYGGTVKINYKKLKFDIKLIENFINSRHSIRNFSNKPVDEKKLKKAIILAQRCPSACNRQGVRVYVVDKSKAKTIKKDLQGIGGFSESIDKIVIITGKLSSYRFNEYNQYIVSASMYAAYLSLTLHLYGLGACVIQRSVIWNKKLEKIKKFYDIDDDEQIICMIGVGNVDGEIDVPISHRIDIDEFYKYIK